MASITGWMKIDEAGVVKALQEAGDKLGNADGDVVLDFSSVGRIDPSMVRAMGGFAGKADAKDVSVTLRGVSVDVYKVLMLVKLVRRFSFVN